MVARRAVQALGLIGGKKAVKPLNHALKDKEKEVQEAAIEALKRIDKKEKTGK